MGDEIGSWERSLSVRYHTPKALHLVLGDTAFINNK